MTTQEVVKMKFFSPQYLRIEKHLRDFAIELFHNITTQLDDNFNRENGEAIIKLKNEPGEKVQLFLKAELEKAGWDCTFDCDRMRGYFVLLRDPTTPPIKLSRVA